MNTVHIDRQSYTLTGANQEFARRAYDIAGAIWDGRILRTGLVSAQIEAVAKWENKGTDGDLLVEDRKMLRGLAAKAKEAGL